MDLTVDSCPCGSSGELSGDRRPRSDRRAALPSIAPGRSRPWRLMGRRQLLEGGALAVAGLLGLGWTRPAWAQVTNEFGRNRFTLARIIYNGSWDAGLPKADLNLTAEFQRLTGDRFATDIVQVSLGDRELFRYPFLYITGFSGSNVFSLAEAEALRRHLTEGGFLFASDCGQGGREFATSIRKLMDEQVFRGDPKAVTVQLDDQDHPILNLVVPFSDWSPGIYRPGRYTGWEYDGRLVCFMAAEYDNNCILAGRAADGRVTQQCLWQGVNVLYHGVMV
ncbi:MAG: DUF4159 domain-containing protein [Candidatus Riflebacteria bacterium]|nr:DUF4159 domain-containing protein [Candidatus Riflebacteria bacterium]